jgi:hypothetical protein
MRFSSPELDYTPQLLIVVSLIAALIATAGIYVTSRESNASACLAGIGFLPIAFFAVLYIAFAPFSTIIRLSPFSFAGSFLIMCIWVAPNFLIAFLFASCVVIFFPIGGKRELSPGVTCTSLLLLHVLGAIHLYVLW